MRKYLGYIIAIALLAILIVLEILGINSLRQKPRTTPEVLGGTTGQIASNNEEAPKSFDNDNQTNNVAKDNSIKDNFSQNAELATYVYDTEGKINVPGDGTIDQIWKDTWQIKATPGAIQKNVTVKVTSNRDNDAGYSTRYVVKPDGAMIGTFVKAASPQGLAECTGLIPIYLPPGQNTSPANMSCTFDGQQAFELSGQATAGPQTDFNWKNQKKYKVRELTLMMQITSGGDTALPGKMTVVAAPGIGPITFQGSIADLIFGQLLTVVSGDSESQLIDFDNDLVWRPQ